LLSALLLFGIVGMISYKPLLNSLPITEFIVMQAIFIGIGILHNWTMDNFFDWPEENKFAYKLLFTIAVALLGSVSFSLIIGKFGSPSYFEVFIPTVISFIVPFMVWQSFLYASNIPARIYKSWSYPRKHLPDPDLYELKNPQVISLYFKKSENATDQTHFRVKAPESMNFGVFFYHFINDYNTSHPESTIQYDNSGEEGWIFFHKPGLLPIRKYVDHEFTVMRNNIQENQVIICERV
jgi:hypothetical protein